MTLSIIILNETIRAELIVFIALFADLGTIAIAYDNAPYARNPVEWQLPKIWLISTILGALLAAATWVLRGTLFLKDGGIIQNYGSVQEILFLEVALTEVSSGPSSLVLWPVRLMLSGVTELVDFRDSWNGNLAVLATRRGDPRDRYPCQHFRPIRVDFWSRTTQRVRTEVHAG